MNIKSNIRHIFVIIFSFLLSSNGIAQSFNDYFTNKTLRLDYIFSGDAEKEYISLNNLSQLPQWSGRRNNLSGIVCAGNGQIKIYDAQSEQLIYMDAFSTLFYEWQATNEAKIARKSFENTFLIPYPKKDIKVKISFRRKDGNYDIVFEHKVTPSDILIQKKGLSNIPAYTIIHQGDSVHKCINVAILAEGYTAEEMPKFREKAKAACEAIFSHSPFSKMKDKFIFYAVETTSKNSGVSVPHDNIWLDTAFESHFDTFYSDRYLTTSRVSDIHNAIAGIPYSHIIILANTDVYGGGGIFNAYTLTTTNHPDFLPVIVHEFGHSFGGLADEYFYESDVLDQTYATNVEPWEANITSLVNFEQKWKDMLQPKTPVPTNEEMSAKYPIGVYEGGGYLTKGIYRPAIDCRMKTNTCKDFCPVCQRNIERLIKFYTE